MTGVVPEKECVRRSPKRSRGRACGAQFGVTKWGKDANGKSFPVEWTAKGGAEVNIDVGHTTYGPAVPHVGYQTPGKGGTNGHILLDEVPVNRSK